jgi:hypothetical protein
LFDVSPPDGPFIASSKKNGPFSETWFAFAETISPLMFGRTSSEPFKAEIQMTATAQVVRFSG